MAYYFTPTALKDFKKLSKPIQKRIVSKLDFYAGSADPLRFARALVDKSFGEYRFRVGDYRIVFDFEVRKNTIIVLALGHRKDIYK